MAWYLNPALSQFRSEVNAAYPGRDKKSDGTIADDAHASWSQHQPDPPPEEEVDAWDMDVEVNGIGKPYRLDVERLKWLFENHPSSYRWIHEGRTATRANGWREVDYVGDNPHDLHVHWETRESHDEVATPFGVNVATMLDDPTHAAGVAYRLKALIKMEDPAVLKLPAGTVEESNELARILRVVLAAVFRLEAAVAAVPPGGLTVEQVRAVVREELDKTRFAS